VVSPSCHMFAAHIAGLRLRCLTVKLPTVLDGLPPDQHEFPIFILRRVLAGETASIASLAR
jgi:hypothetical protein